MKENSAKIRQGRKLERKAGQRPHYARVLMVCEGKATEPNYFNGIRAALRLSSAHMIALSSDFGTGPEKVVEFAEWKARQDAKADKAWDEVYCIFDRDEHVHFDAALRRIKELQLAHKKPRATLPCFTAIPSVPCFELWFLLHYELLTRQEERTVVLAKLKTHISDYGKSRDDMFVRLCSKLDTACRNAATLRKRKTETGNENPTTDADILVRRLHEIGELKISTKAGGAKIP